VVVLGAVVGETFVVAVVDGPTVVDGPDVVGPVVGPLAGPVVGVVVNTTPGVVVVRGPVGVTGVTRLGGRVVVVVGAGP
jgi:hypothetical protein